jgi:DNA polymerase/3'-5' exonuclease PolX
MTAPTKERYALVAARTVAQQLVGELAPACERIAIAGSIRRKIPEVSDIELVVIPKVVELPGPATLFGDDQPERLNVLDELCHALRSQGTLADRLDKNGRAAWGPRFKRMRYRGCAVDLFVVTPETWGVQLALRTGPADYSHQLVTPHGVYFRDSRGARRGGLLPLGMRVADGRLLSADGAIETPEERDLFAVIDEPYREPWSRT